MVRLVPATAVGAEAQREAFEAAFADYLIGPMRVTPQAWPTLLAAGGVDLGLSRLALDATGSVQAFSYCAPRLGLGRWRLAAMGARPEARRHGAASALLADFIARGKAAGLVGLELECFAQNPRALALYERHGFVTRHALHGFQQPAWQPQGPAAEPEPEAVDREAALAWLGEQEQRLGELPLQFGPTTLAQREGWQAWRRGSAQLVMQPSEVGPVRLLSVLDVEPEQRNLEVLLLGLAQRMPGRDWQVPELLREDLGGSALRRLGWQPSVLHQGWMLKAFG